MRTERETPSLISLYHPPSSSPTPDSFACCESLDRSSDELPVEVRVVSGKAPLRREQEIGIDRGGLIDCPMDRPFVRLNVIFGYEHC